jgi:hypothetical protein
MNSFRTQPMLTTPILTATQKQSHQNDRVDAIQLLANNICAGFRQLISSLHFMSHFIFTLWSHTPLPPPHHPSPPQPTISTITATPLEAVLTLFFIFTSAPCSRRQLIPSRCLFAQAKWRGVHPPYTHHHHTINTTSTTVRQSIHLHKHTTKELSMHTMATTNTI